MNSSGKTILTILGIILILLGLAINEWTLVTFFDPDGAIDSFANRLAVWSFDLLMIFIGVVILRHRDKKITKACVVKTLGCIFVALVIGEIVLRVGISLGIPVFRDPDLYADWSSSDTYWKLVNLWHPDRMDESFFDPQLGWSPPETDVNPLGIITDTPYAPRFDEPVILFYGDSFVDGNSQPFQNIPDQLQNVLGGEPVYNYGVRGYGLDQIFLRMKQSYVQFERPMIIIGMLTADIDRCVLKIRTALKPYFSIENETLVLKGVPVDADTSQWLEKYPPAIKSYLLSAVKNKLFLMLEALGMKENCRQREKEKIVSLLIEAIQEQTQRENIPLVFVVFYPQQEIYKTTWREKFLKDELTQRGLSFLDTKSLFIENIGDKEGQLRGLYLSDGHLSEKGNKLVSEALIDFIGKE